MTKLFKRTKVDYLEIAANMILDGKAKVNKGESFSQAMTRVGTLLLIKGGVKR